jgi:hypothetical protein
VPPTTVANSASLHTKLELLDTHTDRPSTMADKDSTVQSPPRLSKGQKKRQRTKASKARKAALLDESPVETIRTTKAIRDIDAELQQVQQELKAAKESKEKRAQLERARKELEEVQSSTLPVPKPSFAQHESEQDQSPEFNGNVLHREEAPSPKRKHDGAMAEASKKQRRTGAASRPSTTSRPPATSCPPSASTRQKIPQDDPLDPGFREYIRKANFNKDNDPGARSDEMYRFGEEMTSIPTNWKRLTTRNATTRGLPHATSSTSQSQEPASITSPTPSRTTKYRQPPTSSCTWYNQCRSSRIFFKNAPQILPFATTGEISGAVKRQLNAFWGELPMHSCFYGVAQRCRTKT